jgi:hypothetical protein
LVAILSGALIVGGPFLDTIGFHDDGEVMAAMPAMTTQSTTIALTSDDRQLIVVNRESNSVAVIEARKQNVGCAAVGLTCRQSECGTRRKGGSHTPTPQ